jgi:AcrR family transcriptional regulator
VEGKFAADHGTSLRSPDPLPAEVHRPVFRKLHPGPGLSAEEVATDQRLRLREAMVELVGERGYDGVTVRALAGLSKVSTHSFYQHFTDIEACFSYTYESLLRSSLRHTYAAQVKSGDWRERIRTSLRMVLDELDRHPRAARLVLVEAFAPGLRMQPVIRKGVAGFECLLAENLPAGPPRQRPRHMLLGMASGVTRAARGRVEAGVRIDAADLGRELGEWLIGLAETTPLASDAAAIFPRARIGGAETAPVAERFGEVGEERGRILAATAKIALSDGYGRLTGPRIRAAASVSRRAFDANFADVGDCFLATVEAVAAAPGRRGARLLTGSGDWEQRVQRVVAALCAEAARNQALARLVFVELLAAGSRGLRRRERMIAAAASQLRDAAPADRRPPPLVAEASLAAAWQIAQVEVAAGRAVELPSLAPTLAALLAR